MGPEDENVVFLKCASCQSHYALEDGDLHDRWLMPITLPLYMVMFSQDPCAEVERVLDHLTDQDQELKELMVSHIREELEIPKQRVSRIFDFLNPDEDELRKFLSLLADGLL